MKHPILPERAVSRTMVRVRFCETDLMGIVHHASYLAWFEVGRVDWLRKRGVTYAVWADRGMHLPVIEANLQYARPARFDDELVVTTTLTELRAASLRFGYSVERAGEVLATGSTRLACIDERHRVRKFDESTWNVLVSGES
jgi:acyl-CoA thioester hydrolase